MISSNLGGLTGCDLLRGLVFGGKSNSEIQSRLEALSDASASFQRLAFELTELFLAPGKYEYKLLLNKEKLTIDPDNPESVHDGFDGCNSVLRVSG
ncbi:MAG: hypothetical protein WCG85_01990 [Polyangia bacterium]